MKAQKVIPLVVVAAGLLAYHNSFRGEFIRDDLGSIPDNPTIRHLWPIWQCLTPPHGNWLTVEGRPLINLSLAVNYALGGYNVWGYHALNLTVHILAGLTLLGIVRRTLLQPRLRNRFGAAANELALATAVLWTVHPLQTESVTYHRSTGRIARGTVLPAHALLFHPRNGVAARDVCGGGGTRDEPRSRLWYGLSVTACALGMASKEVMVSAPLIVMLYDRAFLSNSFREAWQRRWPLYLALAGTWILLSFLLASAGSFANAAINAQLVGVGWWQYLATEPGVILYYLRLCVWPCPLLLGHGWPIAKMWMNILPPTLMVVILLATSAWALRKNSVWGFVGAWFFLILAPSSSFIPLHDPFYEHRMYLSLAAVVSLVVIGLYSLAGRQSVVVVVVAAVGLGFLTYRRNQDYRSDLAMQFGAVTQQPNDPLAHYSLGVALERAGRIQEAIEQYKQAARLNPHIAEVHNNLGFALAGVGRIQEAVGQYEQALRINPDSAEPHNNLAIALAGLGKLPEAVEHFEQALRIKPDFAEAHYNLGKTLKQAGRVGEAIGHYEQALRIKPDYAEAHYNLGNSLLQVGRIDEAIGHYEEALRIKPDFVEAHYNLGVILEQSGKVQEAVRHWEQALKIKPDFAEARDALARLRAHRE